MKQVIKEETAPYHWKKAGFTGLVWMAILRNTLRTVPDVSEENPKQTRQQNLLLLTLHMQWIWYVWIFCRWKCLLVGTNTSWLSQTILPGMLRPFFHLTKQPRPQLNSCLTISFAIMGFQLAYIVTKVPTSRVKLLRSCAPLRG